MGHIAQILGTDFDAHLMDNLYPILEKLGDSSDLVAKSAWTTLERISYYCKYESVSFSYGRFSGN